MKKQIFPSIFKAYDIRGIYPSEISREMAYNIGQALVAYTKAKKVVVGYDMRESSMDVEMGVISGIIEAGADVIQIGLTTTPILYFASWNMEVDAGVMVTASHNPAQYNGMKFCLQGAVPIGEGSGMEEIKALAIKDKFLTNPNQGKIYDQPDFKKKYYEYVLKYYKRGLGKKKIVIDFANAMGIMDKPIYEALRDELELTYLFDDYDGRFPNHEANPLKNETLGDLQLKVKETGADLGLAYDGDADRIGFVDEKGEIVRMDFITALLAEEILKMRPGGLILADIRSSNAVMEFIREAGGQANYSRIGHSLIKAQMRREGAIFAGELSGHYFFEENSKAEMTALAAIVILNLLNESGKKMSELVEGLKRYYQSGEINSDVADKDKVLKKLKEKYADGKLNELDGIRIDYPDFWFNVRPSNTEPKLRLNLEAKTKELMEEKKEELLKLIRA